MKKPLIAPTVGRIVHFRTVNGDALAALVVHVLADDLVNLTVFDADGTTFARHSVTLAHDRKAGPFECEWMPFQKGQAVNLATEIGRIDANRFPAIELPKTEGNTE